jgi:LacI family transcriptional regulator
LKVTVSAIAKSCSLSTATVDRVLHDRPGASTANRYRVMEAALRLGYLPTAGSVPLPLKAAKLEFLIPIGQNAFMRELGQQLEIYLRFVAAGGVLPNPRSRQHVSVQSASVR